MVQAPEEQEDALARYDSRRDRDEVLISVWHTLRVHPSGIQVWQRSLIVCVFDGLLRLLVDKAAGASSASRPGLRHGGVW